MLASWLFSLSFSLFLLSSFSLSLSLLLSNASAGLRTMNCSELPNRRLALSGTWTKLPSHDTGMSLMKVPFFDCKSFTITLLSRNTSIA